MSFIGIIASQKKVDEIKKHLLKYIKDRKVEIIAINTNSIENISKIKFETIVICEDLEKVKSKEKYLTEILKKTEYLIINADLKIDEELLKGVNTKTITYGLKQKSTITISSITENNIIICVQRQIKDINNNIIEPQEINIKVEKNNNQKVYDILNLYSIIKLYNG